MSPPAACVVQPGLGTARALHLARDLSYSHRHPPGSDLTAAESEASTPSLLLPFNWVFFFFFGVFCLFLIKA